MEGFYESLCNVAIRATLTANRGVLEATITELTAAHQRYGKDDTLGLDALAETAINGVLENYCRDFVHITEERGVNAALGSTAETVFITDPIDGSKPFRSFLSQRSHNGQRAQAILCAPDVRTVWEASNPSPARITGATITTTCVHRGLPLGTALVNVVSQELIVACAAGTWVTPIVRFDHVDHLNVQWLLDHGSPLAFPSRVRLTESLAYPQWFIAYAEKPVYVTNLAQIGSLWQERLQRHVTGDTAGPGRTLYFSELYRSEPPITVVLYNGEKISEWIHALPFIRFTRYAGEPQLSLYEVNASPPVKNSGVPMSPALADSVFQADVAGHFRLDFSQLQTLKNPSHYRATLVIAHRNNLGVRQIMECHGYREVRFPW